MGERITDRLQLPTDILLGAAILTLSDNRILKIENVRGILESEKTKVRILTKHFRITIQGEELSVVRYSKEEVEITGYIEKLMYTGREEGV